jgi:hypothetical protein
MKKKDIKLFFKAISHSDLQTVIGLIDTDQEYLTVCNFAPPKKDEGQSGLQVAFKTRNFDIAELLINSGADVNFIESAEIDSWRMPVLHDCIRSVIFNSFTLQKDTTIFDKALEILQLMLDKKANPNAIDSYGNNSLNRAFLDTRQVIVHPYVNWTDDILLTQLRSVFKKLINAGADVDQSNEMRQSVRNSIANYRMDKYNLI